MIINTLSPFLEPTMYKYNRCGKRINENCMKFALRSFVTRAASARHTHIAMR